MAKVKMVKTVTECFTACGKKYRIMKDENDHFWGIDYNDLKEEQIDGLKGNLSRTLNETLRKCYTKARVAEILQGKSSEHEEIIKATITASTEAVKMFN